MSVNRTNLSRRNFITAGVIGATGAFAGLTGCAPSGKKSDSKAAVSDSAEKKYSWETAPDPIDEGSITETQEADIVIVGAGTAGLVCALSAAEEGKSIIVIAKDEAPSGQGGSHFAMNTKFLNAEGKAPDTFTAINHELQLACYMVDSEQYKVFANESGVAMDWYQNLMETGGLSCTLEAPAYNCGGISEEYWGSHVFYGGPNDAPFGDLPDELEVLKNLITKDYGQQIFFNTTAQQLVREDGGRVSAVIATNADGKYIKYVGTKAVVLATGDYGNNEEMKEKWCSYVAGMSSMKMPANNTGDGHKMAMWIGAAMQPNERHAAMVFGPSDIYKSLSVNESGIRFANERVSNGLAAMEILQQPGKHTFSLWDSQYASKVPTFATRLNTQPDTPEMVQASFDAGVADGSILKADTITELAKLIDVDATTLQETVDRYNELCAAGTDTDYYKSSEFMIPVATAPFYAIENKASLLVTLGGLDVTADMEVRDTEGKVIEGLYALGAIAGNFYANTYTTYFCGVNLGRNVCYGYRTGKQLAALK
mgnify:CR=1 FL=1